jgi:tetratricopeptide (TPR) repeat protein
MSDPSDTYARLITAFNQNAWPRVQQLAVQLLPFTPHDAAVHFLAGVAAMEMQQLPSALGYLRKATQLDTQRADFAVQYARALTLVRQMREARLVADRALTLSCDDPFTLDTLGVVYTQVNAHEPATAAFRRAVALMPKHAPYRFNLAYSLIAMGDVAGAERELEACIGLDHRYWTAHLSLAQLHRQTPANNHLERLRSLLPQYAGNLAAQIYLNMTLAKEYEDTADYTKAFEHFVQGKSAGRSARRHTMIRASMDPDSMKRDEAMFEALIGTFSPSEGAISRGDPTTEPIFVIGMPRTGTTLLERIISSHPDVYAAGELQNFPVALQRASGSRLPILFDPEIATRTRDIDWKQLGAAYLSSTRPSTGHTARFIDKLPHNFLYAGFVARALPNAKIICLRRDPMDTCLGNFRHLFEQESPYYDYSFDLLDTGRYYVLFDRLMAHWKNVFPGRILEMHYETLVASQEASSRQLLEFCDLSWNDACLHFENNPAPVNTPNAWQVRSAVYQTAINRWKVYEPQMRHLQELLTGSGIALAP